MSKEYITWSGKTNDASFILDFFDNSSPDEFASLQDFEKKQPGKIDEVLDLYNDNPEPWNNNEITLENDQILAIQAMVDCLNTWHSKFQLFFSGLAAQELQGFVIKEMQKTNDVNLERYRAAIDWWDDENNRSILSSDVLDRLDSALGTESYFYQHLIEHYEMGLHDDLCDMYLSILNYFDDETCHYNLGLVDSDGDLALSEDDFQKTKDFLSAKPFIKDFYYASYRFDKVEARNC
jgi:hypothetical protein